MSLDTLLQELNDSNERTRLRALYQLGILGDSLAIPAIQQTLENDPNAELRNVARAVLSHVQNTSQMSATEDAKADVEWTRQFVQHIEKSANFMAFDVSDLTQQVSDEALDILRSSGVAVSPNESMSGIVDDSSAPSASTGSIAGMLSGIANEISKGQRSSGGILQNMLTNTLRQASQSQGSPNNPQKPEMQFEMLWDCEFCGAEKLLGVTHRHCPNCGAAQDPANRYFPAPGEEVALENHRFVGVDVLCPACDSPNSASAKFCGNCGADVTTGEKAAIREDQVSGMGAGLVENKRDLVKEKFQAQQARLQAEMKERERNATFIGRNRSKVIGGGVITTLGLVGAFVYGFFFMRITENVTIESHSWERSYQIQEYQEVRETSDCSAMPGGADVVSRRTESRRVQEGETCRQECEQRRVDQGDGSGRMENVCRNVCEPNYVQRNVQVCTYDIDKWVNINVDWAEEAGNSINPVWPDVGTTPSCNNAPNRIGEQCWKDQEEKYTLHFVRENGDNAKCDMDNVDEWRSFEDGQEVSVAFTYFSRLRDKALCDTLEPIE